MEFIDPVPTGKGPDTQFTGDVWYDVIYAGEEPSRARTNMVRFSPGARTFWHRHVLGQTLHIVTGIALVGTRDGVVFEAHPGESVTCPAGEEHWHGATEDRFMEHVAIWEGDGTTTSETTWLEEVTDQQYAAPRTRRN
ncbi:cupin domain-containing protein [Rhodococcus sp. NPDC058521]|uniref:(R)-mandelonitrile lyase n=1 Tax=Rhodococcus sp. NPDC058521 TaxID=3346536 RepID=UPI003665A828